MAGHLIAEPKNKVDHAAGQAIVLHVFWEAPSAAAATELLEGLRKCARATHWDTPHSPFVLLAVISDFGFGL